MRVITGGSFTKLQKKDLNFSFCATNACCHYIFDLRPLKSPNCIKNKVLVLHFSLAHEHFIFWGPYLMMHTVTERQMIALTRVNLPVTAHSIGIHNILEARGKFVGPYQGRGSVVGGDTIDKGRNCCSAFSLKYQCQIKL